MTYFRMGSPHYHRRAAVSRSCSGWEGVVPAGYGRQALTVGCPRVRGQPHSEEAKHWVRLARTPSTKLRALSELNRSALTVMGSSRTGN